jgi:hypothetical protein
MPLMPSRLTTLAILAFWLFVAGWFVAREVWPHLASDAPPAFVIDITDEAIRQVVPVRWVLYRNGERLAALRTTTEYRESDDSFLLTSAMGDADIVAAGTFKCRVHSLVNVYRVNRAGELHGSETKLAMTVFGVDVKMTIAAEVRGNQAQPYCRLEYPGGILEPALKPIPVARAGVLNPLHPVHRIVGLKPGMRWRLPLVDPLADAYRAAVEGLAQSVLGPNAPALPFATGPRTVLADVTGSTPFDWNGNAVSCYVIEYRGDDAKARTWVRTRDGAVLRQEASSLGEELALQRE